MSSEYSQMEFSERLKRVRSDLSLSQKEMAEKLSIALSTYQYYERGEREAPVSCVCKIASFGVNLDWLLTGVGNPYKSIEPKPEIKHEKTLSSPECSTNYSEIGDAEIIQRFNDKRYAKELNSNLVELEQLNQEAFKKVGPYIKGLLDGLRMPRSDGPYSGPDRRVKQRRVKDNPKKNKAEKDRRSGKERRVAAQR
jgi:transcriptional regulator with XRE-family HTH domain